MPSAFSLELRQQRARAAEQLEQALRAEDLFSVEVATARMDELDGLAGHYGEDPACV